MIIAYEETKGDSMFTEQINNQILNILSKQYQSVWLIKLEDLSLVTFSENKRKSFPQNIEAVQKMNNYDDARIWYIENNVVDYSKKRLLDQTSIDNVIHELSGEDSFYIEYGRQVGNKRNFNQIIYDKIVNSDNETEYILMGFRDIEITKKSEIDDMTGLLTRAVFFDRAEEIIHDNPDEQFDVILSDIVDFKKINETYGVAVADSILKWNGDFLLSNRVKDTIIGRFGGDQMAIFGPHSSMSIITSTKLREEFNKAERENGLPSAIWKFGVYEYIPHDSSIVAICDKAHMALNTIKHHYIKDMAFYTDEIAREFEKQRRIENSMYKSLEEGDFQVYYQPKHDSKTGALVGAEALIRWIHPEYGFMSPADFIPLFEQNGFIVENDRFVWRRTCENLRRWLDKGIKTVPISVNASKLTMSNADIVANMKEAVQTYNLDASQLHIEITETLMTENTVDLVKKLNEIREAGFKVELDDFGSGYSSINVLSILPIDILKLDMSFMQEFGDKKRSLVLESCIDLAKKLGFETVSEGVEIKEQTVELERLGVDMIQGYYYSKPLPEQGFELYMMQHAD